MHASCSDVRLANLQIGVQSPVGARNVRSLVWSNFATCELISAWVYGGWSPEEPVKPKFSDSGTMCGCTGLPIRKTCNHWVGKCKMLEQLLDMVYHKVGKWKAVGLHQEHLASNWPLCDETVENSGSFGSDPVLSPPPTDPVHQPQHRCMSSVDSWMTYFLFGLFGLSCEDDSLACGSTNFNIWSWNCWPYCSCLGFDLIIEFLAELWQAGFRLCLLEKYEDDVFIFSIISGHAVKKKCL